MVRPFEFQKLALDGAWLIKAFRAEDNRGVFVKDWSRDIFLAAGINHSLLETFYTYSHKGVVRALHFQEIK
jgi:dTDP-4-dehydrorhamnose 3,5-epimerase